MIRITGEIGEVGGIFQRMRVKGVQNRALALLVRVRPVKKNPVRHGSKKAIGLTKVLEPHHGPNNTGVEPEDEIVDQDAGVSPHIAHHGNRTVSPGVPRRVEQKLSGKVQVPVRHTVYTQLYFTVPQPLVLLARGAIHSSIERAELKGVSAHLPEPGEQGAGAFK